MIPRIAILILLAGTAYGQTVSYNVSNIINSASVSVTVTAPVTVTDTDAALMMLLTT